MRLSSVIPPRSEVVRKRVLGTEASYRVLHEAGPIVQVEVLDAPGLAPGTHVYLSSSAVAHMRHAPVLAPALRRSTRTTRLAARIA